MYFLLGIHSPLNCLQIMSSGQPGSSKSLSPSPAPNPIQYTESTNTNPANSAEEVDQHKLSRFESLRRKIKSRSSYQEADSGSNRLSTDSSCNRCRAVSAIHEYTY